MPQSKRVVIIGAGPGGLACAMLMARAGARVTVLERRPVVGGRTSTLVGGGFQFDLGPTFFLYPRVLEEIFQSVGRNLHDEIELIKLDPQYHLIFGAGGDLFATPDLPRMEENIARLAPGDAGSFRRFMADNRVKMDRFRPILESPFRSARDLISPKVAKMLPSLRPWRTLDGELRRYFGDERIRLALTFQSKYLGMSPFNCPSLFSILAFLEYEFGVFHPVGGCGAVSRAMAEVAGDLGVEISLDDEVQEMTFAGRRATGVRSKSGLHAADAVVINADFARAMHRFVPDRLRRNWTDAKIASKRFSCSTFMLYLGIEGNYPHLAHHTIYLARNYRDNLDDIESRHVLSSDPSFYVQNACTTDPALAPPGMSTLYVLVPVTHQHANVDWAQEKSRYRDQVLRQLAKIGLDDVEQRIRFEHMITPNDWDNDYEIHRGSTFNLAHNLRQMLHLRPRNRFDDLQSVYLVGGGTHPGSGLPIIFEGARTSARLMAEDLGLPACPIDVPARQKSTRERVMIEMS
jgi:phytoene desaturase